ncbi:MAG: hypothetical protein LGB01_01750 [Sulfurovum sp.]|nr:hypothetical protein [Sulfurovum sp.]
MLEQALVQMLQAYYEEKLRNLPRQKNLSSTEKMYQIRKIKIDILPKLKKGELVIFES